ncbi:MAG: phosphate acetyltransferase [Christensenellaceae bacterium]|jgi:phosphate acetyltransferase|nr:phosphate acetyltransferase [Christensenellaceae bacterium]
MSKFMESVISLAKSRFKRVVLAEGEEPRIIEAAYIINKERIAQITLLGNRDAIISKANKAGLTELSGIEIINPSESNKLTQYTDLLYSLRKDKGLTYEEASKLALNPLYFGCLMIKAGDSDGMVAGSINATGDVLRPALQIIKGKKGIKTVSSCFVMALPDDSKYGTNGVMIFSDCAVLPNPTPEQLADIAISAADSARNIANISDPKVALLSFSTAGSAKHELVDKVKTTVNMLKDIKPNFVFDGELQLDAAIVPEVGRLKAPGSPVAGKADVLVFPDLQSGNIGYKLVQRFGGVEAVGPICQGLAAPVNDLSRGCTASDVVSVVAITTLQAE